MRSTRQSIKKASTYISSSQETSQTELAKTKRKKVKHIKIEYENEYSINQDNNGSEPLDNLSKNSSPLSQNYENIHTLHALSSNEPPNWRKVYTNILEMRKNRDAPVDSMGAQKCSDFDAAPEVFRFQVLVSLMLSSQTKDQVTSAAMQRLRTHGLTIQNILDTPDQCLQDLIYPVGFYKRKTEYLKKSCVILNENFNGDIPSTIDGLCSLPGVGKKMAYLCMEIAWGKMEGIGVDTHVHRISNRLGWTGAKGTGSPEATRAVLQSWLPRQLWSEVNLLLVGFGQQKCLPIGPMCHDCLNKEICPFGRKMGKSDKK